MNGSSLRLCVMGATGATGRLVAVAARDAGVHPVLVGRNEFALDQLAAEIGEATVRSIDLANPASLDTALADVDVVANCIGPFSHTGLQIAEAAVRAGTPYVDTSGEPVFGLALKNRFADARTALVTAVGVAALLGDLAAAIGMHRGGGNLEALSVHYRLSDMRPSAGTLRSTLEIVGDGAVVFRDGEAEVRYPGGMPHRHPAGSGVLFAVPDPVVISLYHPARRIDAYLGGPATPVVGAVMRTAAVLLRNEHVRRGAARGLGRLPLPKAGSHGSSAVSVADGDTLTTASAHDTYQFTAQAVVLVAQALAVWSGPGGLRAASEILPDPWVAAERLGIQIS